MLESGLLHADSLQKPAVSRGGNVVAFFSGLALGFVALIVTVSFLFADPGAESATFIAQKNEVPLSGAQVGRCQFTNFSNLENQY